MTIQIIARTGITFGLTFFYILSIYYVWTNEIDIRKTLIKPFTSIVKFKPSATLEVDFKQVMSARFVLRGNTQSGNYGFIFYDMKFVNTSDENMTVKNIVLRYNFNGIEDAVDSMVLPTGSVLSPQGESKSIIVRNGANNIFLMNWKNLRPILAEHKTLSPGGVLAGSAAFVLAISKDEDLARLKSFQLVAVDYSGNEFVKEIPMQSDWISMAKANVIENRMFIHQDKKTDYLD